MQHDYIQDNLVRMRSPVQIWLAAPENPVSPVKPGVFLTFSWFTLSGETPFQTFSNNFRLLYYTLAPRICDIWRSGAANSGEFFISCIKAATAGSVTGDAASFFLRQRTGNPSLPQGVFDLRWDSFGAYHLCA